MQNKSFFWKINDEILKNLKKKKLKKFFKKIKAIKNSLCE